MDGRMRVLQLRATRPRTFNAHGAASLNLLNMVRDDLKLPLRSATARP
jgi:hypothetical protein